MKPYFLLTVSRIFLFIEKDPKDVIKKQFTQVYIYSLKTTHENIKQSVLALGKHLSILQLK